MLGRFNALCKFQAIDWSYHLGFMSDEDVPRQASQTHADKGLHALFLWLSIYLSEDLCGNLMLDGKCLIVNEAIKTHQIFC